MFDLLLSCSERLKAPHFAVVITEVLSACAGRKKRRASRQSSDLGPLPVSADNPMAIMSYQPLDDQLSTQFLEMLSDDPTMRPPAASMPGEHPGARQASI